MQSCVENNCIKYFLLKDIIIKHAKHKRNSANDKLNEILNIM